MSARLVPDLPLPPYAFVPGRRPHPVSDPAGHSHVAPACVPIPMDPSRWATRRDYLYGIDLFNSGYYWEAHETWEGLWHGCGRTGPTADFLKALIKLAAAGVKVREGRPEGAAGHASGAAELLREIRGSHEYFMGLALDELIRFADATGVQPPRSTEPAAPVEVVFSFVLRPEHA
jgi:hypothetical protein